MYASCLSTKAMRKLSRQVDSPEAQTSWLNTLGLHTADGTLASRSTRGTRARGSSRSRPGEAGPSTFRSPSAGASPACR